MNTDVEGHLLINKQSGMITNDEYQQGLRDLKRERLDQSIESLIPLIDVSTISTIQ